MNDQNNPSDLIEDSDLIELARESLEFAYAPYSKFLVGAALVTTEGRIFTGVNVENASYGLTICAERTALFKAVSEGEQKIDRIAIVSSSGELTPPCGACRQVMREFGDITVVLADGNGDIVRHSISSLLPDSFGPENL